LETRFKSICWLYRIRCELEAGIRIVLERDVLGARQRLDSRQDYVDAVRERDPLEMQFHLSSLDF
jgi:hypothetical protein